MSGKVSAYATVDVTLRIQVPDSWGEDCTVAQVHKQAKESALGVLRSALAVDGWSNGIAPKNCPRVETVGEPKVKAITTEKA